MARRDLGPDSHSPKRTSDRQKGRQALPNGCRTRRPRNWEPGRTLQSVLFTEFHQRKYAASREIVLNGGAVPLAGPDAQGAVYRGNPYLPVADRFRPGVLGDGLDQGFHVVIEGDNV